MAKASWGRIPEPAQRCTEKGGTRVEHHVDRNPLGQWLESSLRGECAEKPAFTEERKDARCESSVDVDPSGREELECQVAGLGAEDRDERTECLLARCGLGIDGGGDDERGRVVDAGGLFGEPNRVLDAARAPLYRIRVNPVGRREGSMGRSPRRRLSGLSG